MFIRESIAIEDRNVYSRLFDDKFFFCSCWFIIIYYGNTHINNQKSLIPGTQKALLIKKVLSNMTQITIDFLDNTGNIIFDPSNIPYGVEITAPSIDNHIINLFGNKD